MSIFSGSFWSQLNSIYCVLSYRFDLLLAEWDNDVNVLQDTVIVRNFIGLTEDWVNKKHKNNDAVVRSLFVNKYKDVSYHLPAQNEGYTGRLHFIQE